MKPQEAKYSALNQPTIALGREIAHGIGVQSGEPGAAIRLTTREVCALGRFSTVTLWRRVRNGRMPPPIDRGRQSIFDSEAVFAALKPTHQIGSSSEAGRQGWAAEIIAERAAFLKSRRASKPLAGVRVRGRAVS